MNYFIYMFRQRLFHKSVKAYATMPIGVMGRKRLALIDGGSRCLRTRKEKAYKHLFVLFPSMSLIHLKNVCQRKTGGFEKCRKKGVGRSPPYSCCMKVLAN